MLIPATSASSKKSPRRKEGHKKVNFFNQNRNYRRTDDGRTKKIRAKSSPSVSPKAETMGGGPGGAEAPPGPSEKIGKYLDRKVLKSGALNADTFHVQVVQKKSSTEGRAQKS